MLNEFNIAARFLPTRQFHVSNGSARAVLTAGCNRVGHGQNIQCGVDVSVQDSPTAGTRPNFIRQLEVVVRKPADMTSFRGRKPTVNFDQAGTRQFGFVFKLANNLRHCGIHDRFCKASVLRHAFDAQVLNRNQFEPADKSGGKIVGEVLSDVRNSLMKSGKFGLGLLPVPSAFLSTAQFFVESSKSKFIFAKSSRRRNLFSSRKNRKVFDSEVYPNFCLGFAAVGVGPFGVVNLNLDGEIPTSRMFTESSGKDFSGESQPLASTDPSKFGNPNPFAVKLQRPAFDAKGRFGSFLRFEPRIPRFPAFFHSSEEVGEGVSEVTESQVGNGPRKFCKPRESALFNRIQFLVQTEPRRFFAGFVQFLPAGKAPVENESRCPGAPLKKRGLLVVGVKSYLLSENHFFSESADFPRASVRILRTNSPMVISSRSDSTRIQSKRDFGICMSNRTIRFRFLRLGILVLLHTLCYVSSFKFGSFHLTGANSLEIAKSCRR